MDSLVFAVCNVILAVKVIILDSCEFSLILIPHVDFASD